MFCVIDTKSGKEYLIGDKMELCLSASKQYKFKCILEDVLENGQIVLGSLQVKVKDEYKSLDGHFKTGVYELLMVRKSEKGRNKYNSLALKYKGKDKHDLIAETGEIIAPDSKIILKMSNDISETTYKGTYTGITETGLIGMSCTEVSSRLYITGNDFTTFHNDVTLVPKGNMYVEGYGVVKVG